MTDPNERLKQARENAGFRTAADAARRFGWTFSTYAGHENGSAGIRPDKAETYGKAFRVDPAWILYGGQSNAPAILSEPPEGESSLVPVFDIEASAGHGSIAISAEEVVEMLSFPKHYLQRIANRSNAQDLVIISAKGDSMLPTIASGDVVMVDISKRDWGYDGLFVIRDGDGALLIKRLARSGRRGHVTIISDNARLYPAIEADAGEIEIVGKVLWMGVKV